MDIPYWADRLRDRMIRKLGGYTAQDVAKEVYQVTCDTPLCKVEKFKTEEYQTIVGLGGPAFAPPDKKRVERAKDEALLYLGACLMQSKAVQYRTIPWPNGEYGLQVKIRVAVPDAQEGQSEN